MRQIIADAVLLPAQPEEFLRTGTLMADAPPQAREQIQMGLAIDALRQFGQVRFVARGCSMVPSIFPGDVLTIRFALPSLLAPGDIVLRSREGRFYIHRLLHIWKRDEQYFLQTRGDALHQPDPISDTSQLLGYVAVIERHGKRIGPGMTISGSILAALGRRSDFVTKTLLRFHSVRTRLSCLAGPMRRKFIGNFSGAL